MLERKAKNRRLRFEQRAALISAIIVAALLVIQEAPPAQPHREPNGHAQEYLSQFVQRCIAGDPEKLKQMGDFAGEQIGAYCGCAAGSALTAELIKEKGIVLTAEVTGGAAQIYCISGLAASEAPKVDF
jgi:hypothetical protein